MVNIEEEIVRLMGRGEAPEWVADWLGIPVEQVKRIYSQHITRLIAIQRKSNVDHSEWCMAMAQGKDLPCSCGRGYER
jgi:hypothetical protein